MYYRNAAAAILVVDVTQSDSLKVADRWIMDIRQKTDDSDCYIILAINKIDLSNRAFSFEEIKSLTSSERNSITLDSNMVGYRVFDSTLGKDVIWSGSKWIDATGADV